jgi:hypothetical protein
MQFIFSCLVLLITSSMEALRRRLVHIYGEMSSLVCLGNMEAFGVGI